TGLIRILFLSTVSNVDQIYFISIFFVGNTVNLFLNEHKNFCTSCSFVNAALLHV
ncbi:unnamed protein product, partial [Amoebophrya sp. A120]